MLLQGGANDPRILYQHGSQSVWIAPPPIAATRLLRPACVYRLRKVWPDAAEVSADVARPLLTARHLLPRRGLLVHEDIASGRRPAIG